MKQIKDLEPGDVVHYADIDGVEIHFYSHMVIKVEPWARREGYLEVSFKHLPQHSKIRNRDAYKKTMYVAESQQEALQLEVVQLNGRINELEEQISRLEDHHRMY